MELAPIYPVFLMARNKNVKNVWNLTVRCMNVRGCGADEKKCMIVDIFKERKMDVLALSETGERGMSTRMGK